MKILKALLFLLTALAALLLTGCVSVVNYQHSDPAWPKSVAAKNLRRFDGIYQNDSLVANRNKNQPPAKLFDFMTSKHHSGDKSGQSVEIRSASDGSSLCIRLLDRENREIDSATLARGKDFAFSNGALNRYGSLSGWHSENSKFGPSTQSQREKLRLASSGDLLGYASDYWFAFVLDAFPEAIITRSSMYWPKLDQ